MEEEEEGMEEVEEGEIIICKLTLLPVNGVIV